MMRFFRHAILVLLFMYLSMPRISNGRENSFTGFFSIREGYDSNISREDTDHKEGWTTTLSPGFRLTSQESNDSLTLTYAPGFSFDHHSHNADDTRTEHHLDLRGNKNFSPHLTASFSDTFIRSDSTYIETEHAPIEGEVGPLLLENRRIERLWTNTINFQTGYEYAKDSILVLGYANHILDSETSAIDDYVRHNPNTSISFRFNPQWRTEVSYSYVKGDFDQSEDIKNHRPGLQLDYNVSAHNLISGNYIYSNIDYEENREDYDVHMLSLGWEHQIDPQTNLSVSAGYSYADLVESEKTLNYGLNLSKEFAKGTISLDGAGGFDDLHFSGDVDDGLTEFWSFRTSLNYQLSQRLTSNIFAFFRDDEFLERNLETGEKTYEGGGGFSISLSRWFSLSMRYVFLKLDADNDADDYDDHRLFVELTAEKELKRY